MVHTIKQRDMSALAEYRKSLWKKPELRHLFFELTDKCNLRCCHCGSSCTADKGTFLPLTIIEKTLRSITSRYSPKNIMVNLTGGEPLMHPEIFEAVALAHKNGFPVGITSNGTLINNLSAKRLALAGLDTIAISLDGIGEVHDKFRNNRGSFTAALLGIRALKRAEIEPEILTVVHKENIIQLEKIYEFLRSMDIYSWRVVNIEPIGRAAKNQNLLFNGTELKQLFVFIQKKRFDPENSMEIAYGCSHFVTLSYEKMIRDCYFQCGAGTTVGSVMANGDIGACLDIERRPELIQGNIYHDNFVEIWENRFEVFRTDRSQQCDLCKSCKHNPICMGDSAHTWNFETHQPNYCVTKLMEGA